MSKNNSFNLGGHELPMDLGAVLDQEDAQGLALGEGVVKFDFGFRHVRFAAQLEHSQASAHVKLVGDLGPMPFSAESPAARAGIARITEAANQHLGTGFRITQGRVLLGRDLEIPVPVTAVGLVTEVARFLLPALPYMELVAIYVRPPLMPSRPGESALRPEWRRRPGR